MGKELKTDSKLLARLRKSGAGITPAQLQRQRISHILGSLPKDSTITRGQIEKILIENGEGVAA